MRFLNWICVGLFFVGELGAVEDPLGALRAGHPRVLLTAGSIETMRRAAAGDPLRAKLHAQIVASAEAQLTAPPVRYVLVGPRMLAQSRAALGQVTTGAMAYRLSGDRRFLAHAKEVMLTAAAFPDWNPSHFLDVAEMATALGLGYDWLYDELTGAERAAIERALRDKALAYVKPAYGRADPGRESFPFVKGNLTNNWNQVCNGGFVVAALALADKEPELAREVVAGVRETLPYAMAAYGPDGAYPEGPVYWGYGTRYNVIVLAALESALGTDFGLGKLSAFDRTALFRLQVQSPAGLSFNYADGRAEIGADSALTWLGQRFGYPRAVAASRELLAGEIARGANPDDRFLATHAIWFPEVKEVGAKPDDLPLDVHFRGPSEFVVFRGAWDDPRASWVGFKAGSNRVNHGHLDLGSFVLDAEGERWAADLGPDDYDLPGYWDSATVDGARWKIYRLNNRSHNTVTPGDALQQPDAVATVERFGSTPERAAAVVDFSAAYPEFANRFRRGIALMERSRVLVQDEVTGLRAGVPLTWRLLTGAKVDIEGARALLTQNGKRLRMEILAPRGVGFSTHAARPPTARENQNEGITAIEAVCPAEARARDVRMVVLLTPLGEKGAERRMLEIVPLEEWR